MFLGKFDIAYGKLSKRCNFFYLRAPCMCGFGVFPGVNANAT